MCQAIVQTSHTTLFRRCGPCVVASLSRMLLYLLNLTVPPWHQSKLHLPEVPSAVFLLNARQSTSRIISQFQTSIGNHLEVIFFIVQYLADSSVAACCLQFGTFFCPFCDLFFHFVSWIILSKLQAIQHLVWLSFGFSRVIHLPTCILQEALHAGSGIL